MIQNKYWTKFYKDNNKRLKQSSFAEYCLPYVKGELVELGSGNGRDIRFFDKRIVYAIGVDSAFEDPHVIKSDVEEYIKNNDCKYNVYTRFFWHAIDRKLQLEILKWTTNMLFIEARTTDDKFRPKVFKKHERNFINVAQLINDLKNNNFQIIRLEEGTGFSKYKNEDPYLVRVIARKNNG